MTEIPNGERAEQKRQQREYKMSDRVILKMFNKIGTVDAVVSGAKAGDPKDYDVLLDEPLTLGGNDRGPHRLKFEQLKPAE